jgi:diguanylate cyclase (GGDEF)-like protein
MPIRSVLAGCVLASTAAVLVIHIAHNLFGVGSPDHDFLIEEWGYDFITSAVAVVVTARVVMRRDNRLGWLFIGAALTMWAASDLYWTIDLGKLAEPPFPSIADIGYLGGTLLMLAGVATLARATARRMSAIVWADVAIGVLCVAAVGTSLVLNFVLANTTGTPLQIGVAIAYPVLDLVTLAAAAAVLALTGWRPGRALLMLIVAVMLSALGDAVYTYQSLAGTYDPQAWNNSLWPLGTMVVAVAALQPALRRGTASSADTASWRSFASPTIFALTVFVFLLLSQSQSAASLILSCLTMAAIVARIALTFEENRRLVRRLQRDPLTRLGNRSKLLIDLRDALREPGAHVLSILDLDGFKAYNDAFGHPAGDAVLTRLGTKLLKAVEGRGTAYRLGGDEFALLVRGDLAASVDVVAAASTALSEEGEGFQIHSSVGSAELPRETADPANALQLADQRMYAQKDSRRPSPGSEVEAVLVRMLHQRAPELGDHGAAVSRLVVGVGERLGFSESERATLVRAAELHDVGKMAIPDALLQKPEPLDEEEWEFMRQHTILGERIVSEAASLAPLGKLIRSSHERWDGGGYPDRLRGEQIPLAARVIFVCDAYDAMTSERPYRPAFTPDQALTEIRRGAGSQFDPGVVEVFAEALEERLAAGSNGNEITPDAQNGNTDFSRLHIRA